jgi:hypothetical protein
MGYRTTPLSSFAELRERVDAAGGLYVTTMEPLRKLHGASRLGSTVRNNIALSLEANGLGSLPADLPNYQDQPVRVYRLGTPLAAIVEAVQAPSTAGDRVLLGVIDGCSDVNRRLVEAGELALQLADLITAPARA